MNILGFNVTRSQSLRAGGTAFAERTAVNRVLSDKLSSYSPNSYSAEVVKAVGELPMYVPPGQRKPVQSLETRSVPSDPLGDWWLNLPDKIEPKQIANILRQSLAGNLWQQSQLTQKMMDSWVMFKKCAHELRSAVASVRFVVHPYSEPGKEPTTKAKEKADLVRRNLDAMRPNRFADEDGAHGMVYDLTDAVLNGVSIVELLWDKASHGQDRMVRGTAWVHARHIGVSNDGGFGVANSEPETVLAFRGQATSMPMLRDEDKFLVAKFKSKSGSALGAGFMRPLAYYWGTMVYVRDFALAHAQKWGNPFLDIAYEGSISEPEIARYERAAIRAANQGWAVHPSTAKLVVIPAQQMGTGNAQLELMKVANEACQLLMLGQTLTTDVGNSGSRALGDVHENVRMERIESIVKWIANILTEQFAETLIRVNYGNADERPTVEADLARPLSAAEKSTFLTAVSNSKVPLPQEPVYKLLDMPIPQEGETALVNGTPVIMEAAVTPTEQREQQFEQQLNQQSEITKLQQENTVDPEQEKKVQARLRLMNVEELDEIESLVKAAEEKPRLNGSWKPIEDKLKGLLYER